jgi:hypothetical protein
VEINKHIANTLTSIVIKNSSLMEVRNLESSFFMLTLKDEFSGGQHEGGFI